VCLLPIATLAFGLHPAPPRSLGNVPTPQTSDAEIVRDLTLQYGRAIGAGDLDAMRRFWDEQSSELASRLGAYRAALASRRYEIVRADVTRLEVAGDTAISHLTTDERRLDAKTGVVITEREVFHGAARALHWTRTASGWRIRRESLVQEELAARLVAASDRDRRALLESEKPFVTDTLVSLLMTLGYRHRTRGEYDAAIACHRLSQEIGESIGDRVGVAESWLDLAVVRMAQDEDERALELAQKALALYEAAGSPRGIALVMRQLSKIYDTLGDQRRAAECAQRSLRLYEELHHRRGIAEALVVVGNIHKGHNNFKQALIHYEKALAILRELDERFQVGVLRFSIADQYVALGDYGRALDGYRELLEQAESYGDRGGAAVIRDGIGRIHAAQGRFAEALEHYRPALAVLESFHNKGGMAKTLVAMAEARLAQDEAADALPLAERAVSLARETSERSTLGAALSALGYTHARAGHLAEARRAFAEAVAIVESLRGQSSGGVEERQRYFEGRLRAHHGMLGLLVRENRNAEALAFAERTKARALLDVLVQGQVDIEKSMTPLERAQERRLRSELARLNTRLRRAAQSREANHQSTRDLESRLEAARLEHEAFESSLYAAHPVLKVQRGGASPIAPDDLAALLPDSDTALLEYAVAEDAAHLFVVTRPQSRAAPVVQAFTLPIARDELARLTEAFRVQLARRNLDFRDSARRLYALVLGPARSLLEGKTKLVIVPDDALWQLPFQALVTERDRYLMESSEISYAPSLTVLREMKTQRRRPGSTRANELLAVGNPELGWPEMKQTPQVPHEGKLGRLPEAEREVRAVATLYGTARSKVYVGAEAREDRVKAEAGHARVLHFATHGIVNDASPMYSLLVFAGGGGEDGVLEVWELLQLDLTAELAVLSACETAGGRFGAGEGTIGMSWALFVAGVPAAVVSQWKVESASTRALMLRFHRGLRAPGTAGHAPLSKAEALRQAALTVLKNPVTSHPFYWAGFILIGDGG
jgi:CHAT domain-containing protein/tetratricopeptide (TPR) repeat protein